MLPTVGLMIWLFDPVFDPPAWAIWASIPVVLLAFLMRFFVEWALALVALWTTRTAAANQLYFAALLFFSGQMAPLSLLPEWLQTLAALLPFRWMLSLPPPNFCLAASRPPRSSGARWHRWRGWAELGDSVRGLVPHGVRKYSAVGS